jgi:hypothetical protein
LPIGYSLIQVSLHLLTLFLIRQPITEYGRVFVERETIVGDGRETRWLRTVVLNRVDIDGNPNIRQNGGIRGLADVHCLGSMGNHGRRKTADYKIYDYTSCQALIDLENNIDVSLGKCMVLLASRDIQKDEQIICNYEPNAARDMDIPFDNVSLGQFIRICGTSVDSCFKRALSRFF